MRSVGGAAAAVALSLGLLVAASGVPFAAGAPPQSRIIELTATPACDELPWWLCGLAANGKPASGQVRLHVDPSAGQGEAAEYGTFHQIGLGGPAWDAWALYVVRGTFEDYDGTPATTPVRLMFNSFRWGTGSGNGWFGFGLGCEPGSPCWADEPVLTAFVSIEADDGRWFDPAQDMWGLVLIGTSTQ